ncbi:helix-turn-helix domain-containing protein [Megasphaera sp. BL7]|nr:MULTISPECIES: helix-turn-helix domain-containing protein [unclassified Megasphaera]
MKKAPPRFTNAEARKSAGTWFVTKAGMERLFGPEHK